MDNPLSQKNTQEALDIEEINAQINLAQDYLNESKIDFEKAQVSPEKNVAELVNLLTKIKEKIRRLEIKYVDRLVAWKDEDGLMHELLLKKQDEKAVMEISALYQKTQAQFENYFQQHVALLKTHPELTLE
ncbi:MAG: hypothetical protein A2233_03070 [Candidatus Kerfeldbacteria bacterium RIFOXYA2_FULL_38_24]|uniref:Uncharacterized protein n=1 Tax=Candidatus Kerfeldbacteria bacterium RIFOXYB2_FULL_38_14 TaxID=1798547 RepID=A0A1G2BAD4_9BACT|nr:MAG: hypothetical protein A2233_03070 [Candidatus Kerfeldbacteria bacterium RIFOXYA2_FULL_38_24]OGY86178.1 MAG: hypothetical protein A2319_03275 [Candidatus Kerfeldbacteria bacterium RIFOXYB2_FULL_38_14]OGY89458.1 MAG: hypothetical protein A2458_02705 [Candidatus Kerfeldbacteria bacterium RIFOXYC2_FULL_38_9]